MLKRWSFWLPALYLSVLLLAGFDAVAGLSGGGEANLGAWIFIFSALPAIAIARALGANVYLGESISMMVTIVLVQALILLALGVAIDAVLRRHGDNQDQNAQR